jgi:hypothetical protein
VRSSYSAEDWSEGVAALELPVELASFAGVASGNERFEQREVVVEAGKADHEVHNAVLGVGVLYMLRPDQD